MTGGLDESKLADGELAGHDCRWQITAASLTGAAGQLLSPPRTIVVLVCTICGLPITQILSGHWETSQLQVAP